MAVGDVLKETYAKVGMTAKEDIQREETLLSNQKARSDAENQIMLMKRKAASNTRVEESKNGLVIVSAKYYVDGGDCLDVVIPLQFWVMDSMLKLPEGSFGSMLGFYEIHSRGKKDKDRGDECCDNEVDRRYESAWKGLRSLWKHLNEASTKHDDSIPILYVKYKFNDKLYEVQVLDNEGLLLPHPKAAEVL